MQACSLKFGHYCLAWWLSTCRSAESSLLTANAARLAWYPTPIIPQTEAAAVTPARGSSKQSLALDAIRCHIYLGAQTGSLSCGWWLAWGHGATDVLSCRRLH